MKFSKLTKNETERLFELMKIPCYKMTKRGTAKEDIPERNFKHRSLKEKWKSDALIFE